MRLCCCNIVAVLVSLLCLSLATIVRLEKRYLPFSCTTIPQNGLRPLSSKRLKSVVTSAFNRAFAAAAAFSQNPCDEEKTCHHREHTEQMKK